MEAVPHIPSGRVPKPFLGVYFSRCKIYGRLYPGRDDLYFVGNCPRCGFPVKIKRGKEGVKAHILDIACKSSH